MELIYLWIGNFRNLKNMGMSFSDKYEVTYEDRKLLVKDNENYYDYFGAFSEKSKVSSITALVGKNGCGKSNILELIGSNEKKFIVSKDDSYFILYKNEKDFFIEGYKIPSLIKNFDESNNLKGEFFSGEVQYNNTVWLSYLSIPELKGEVRVRENYLSLPDYRNSDSVKYRVNTAIINNLKFNGDNSSGANGSIDPDALIPRYSFYNGEGLDFSPSPFTGKPVVTYESKLAFLIESANSSLSNESLFNNTDNIVFRIIAPKVDTLKLLVDDIHSIKTVIEQYDPLTDEKSEYSFKKILIEEYDKYSKVFDSQDKIKLNTDTFEELRGFKDYLVGFFDNSEENPLYNEFISYLEEYETVYRYNEIIDRGNFNDFYGDSRKEHFLTQIVLAFFSKIINKIRNEDYFGSEDGKTEDRIVEYLKKILLTDKVVYRNSELAVNLRESVVAFLEQFIPDNFDPTIWKDMGLLKQIVESFEKVKDAYFMNGSIELKVNEDNVTLDGILRLIDSIPSYSIVDKLDIRLCNMSAGEFSFLDFFSRLTTAIKESLKPQNFANCLLLLDEPDDNLHPEWKRRFLAELTNMLNTMIPDGYDNYQIIIATHSPFLLSDLPRDSVIRLEYDESEKDSDKKYKVAKKSSDRYLGANIHELLYDKFFMSSAIGEYAKIKINKLLDLINKEDKFTPEEKLIFKESKALIEEIAEPILRNSLMAQWEDRNLSELSELDKLEVLIKENEAKHEKLLNKQKRLSEKESEDNNDSD